MILILVNTAPILSRYKFSISYSTKRLSPLFHKVVLLFYIFNQKKMLERAVNNANFINL